MVTKENICPLCERIIPARCGTKHHLVPRLKGGLNGDKELMHTICHSKIHSYFTEGELANFYNTVDKLLENNEIANFVKWIKNKPANFNDSNKQHRRKR